MDSSKKEIHLFLLRVFTFVTSFVILQQYPLHFFKLKKILITISYQIYKDTFDPFLSVARQLRSSLCHGCGIPSYYIHAFL